jgi:sulfane dehydrogenase subunit SoxC
MAERRLFQQHIRTVPSINSSYWSFAIIGRVRRPLILSFDDLRAFPSQTQRCVIACSGKSRQPLIGEAVWRGVPLRALLDELALDPTARFALIHAADRYTTVLPLDALGHTLVAYEMNGAPLLPEHGFPARLIAPGLHGYKMPKWVERIELSDTPEGGFWESRGWSLDGAAGVKAAILSYDQRADGAIALAGIAYAGGHRIASVHVSIDDGDWMPVPFTQDDPLVLAHWQSEWMPPDAPHGAGDYHISVRVYARGSLAPAHHSVIVKVR